MSKPGDSRFPYLPGIDALWALAVLAVFFYHSGVEWMPGGFLGVDVFFVISGYLITSLLLREFRRGGHVRLGRFWLRRARRLLPAVGVLIAVTMVVAAIVEPDRIDQLRGPALLASVLAIVAFIGWSGLFNGNSGPSASAAASTQTVATVHANPGREEGGYPSAGHSADRHPPDGYPPSSPPRIIALGDSVMIGAKDKLAARLGPGFSMSAEVGRQADEFVAIAQRLKREGHHPQAMIIQMGNNGPLYGDEMEALQKATSTVGELFLVNDYAPVSWVDESNHALAEAAHDWPHTTLIDWEPVAAAHRNLLWDGIHLTPAGAGVYARLVSRVVRSQTQAETAPPANPPVLR